MKAIRRLWTRDRLLLMAVVGALAFTLAICKGHRRGLQPARALLSNEAVAASLGTPVSVCEFPINLPEMHTKFRMNVAFLSSAQLPQSAYDQLRAQKPRARVWRVTSVGPKMVATLNLPASRFSPVGYSVGRDFSYGDVLALEWVPGMERQMRDGQCLTPLASIIDNRSGDAVTMYGIANTIYVGADR